MSSLLNKKKILVKTLSDNLDDLKSDYFKNSCEIIATKRKLNKIKDDYTMSEMEKVKHFETINWEKWPPPFSN